MFRRLVALLLMLCFGLFSAESLFAEAHEDGAPEGAATAEVPRTQAPPAPAASLDSASLDVSVAAALAAPAGPLAVTAAFVDAAAHVPGAPSDGAPGVPTGDGHPLHVCHCLHGHGAWTPLRGADLPERVAAAAPGLRGSDLAPASAHTEPGLRPPIA